MIRTMALIAAGHVTPFLFPFAGRLNEIGPMSEIARLTGIDK